MIHLDIYIYISVQKSGFGPVITRKQQVPISGKRRKQLHINRTYEDVGFFLHTFGSDVRHRTHDMKVKVDLISRGQYRMVRMPNALP